MTELNHQRNLNIFYIFISLTVAFNYVFYPNLYFVQLFVLLYLFIIYKYFADTLRTFLYLSTLVYSIANFTLAVPIGSRFQIFYFYLTLIVYMVLYFLPYMLKYLKQNGFKGIGKNKYLLFLFVFIIYLLVSTLWALDLKMAVKSIYNYIFTISLLFMIILENQKKEALQRTFRFLFTFFLGILSLGILEMFGFHYGVRNHYTELEEIVANVDYIQRIPVVFFYNPNNYAVVLVLLMSAISIFIINRSVHKGSRLLYYTVYAVSLLSLIFTRSRTAWVSIFIALFFYYVVYWIKKNKQLRKKLIVLGLITLTIFFFVSIIPGMQPYYGKVSGTKILKLFNPNFNVVEEEPIVTIGGKGSENQRYTLMYDVIKGVFIEKHILGFGPGNIEKYIESQNNTGGVVNVHSLWFEFLGNYGLFMLIYFVYIYLMMIVDLLKIHIRNHNKYSIQLAGMLFSFIFLSFAPSSVAWFPPFWILLALSASAIHIYDAKEL